MKTIVLILFFPLISHANSFDCDTDGSSVHGNIYRSCGVGEASLESQARLNAVQNAKDEFLINCSSCMQAYDIFIDPKRTSCKLESSTWKCYHLVEYAIYLKKGSK